MQNNASRADEEHFGWRILRLPPPGALVFGAIYGAVAGAFIAWDVAVIFRAGKIVKRRFDEMMEERRQRSD
jgi:hypothetical protein